MPGRALGFTGTPEERLARRQAIAARARQLAGGDVGFFDTILNIGKRIIGLPVSAPARRALPAPVARTALPARRTFGRAAVAGGAGVLGGGILATIGQSIFGDSGSAATAVQALPRGDGGGGVPLAAMGGNGMSFRRTIIQTIRSDDGVVIRQEIKQGAPHIMNKDIQIAKRVFRMSTRMHNKLPKRTVRPSRMKQLTAQVLENALRDKACPPPPCPTR